MLERDFVYWLQGFLELSGATSLNEQQVKMIKDHIALVMTKVTPTYPTTPQTLIYPNLPLTYPNLPKGWEVTCYASKGVECGVCHKLCSEEGGTCKKCQATTTVTVSDDMVQDLKAFAGVDLGSAPIVDVPTHLSC